VTGAPAVLVAAVSGRALAACARRGGFRPLVVDLFGDLDTRDLAEAHEVAPGGLARGFCEETLLPALDRLAVGSKAHRGALLGVVTGAGFEDRPALLDAVAARHTLLGNTAEEVARLKDPWAFAALCARVEVPHPSVSDRAPAEGEWIAKQEGGAGGAHVIAAAGGPAGAGRYHQRRVGGRAISAAFLASGGRCRVLGFSRQWTDPAPGQPFRYGGAVRPAGLPPATEQALAEAVALVVAQTGLCGLNGADFLVRPDGFDLIEINPRPGATLDILTDGDDALFARHIAACAGTLPAAAPVWRAAAAAAATVYAGNGVEIAPGFAWPAWAADRQPHGTFVPAGAPLCTVLAEAEDATAAETLVRARANAIAKAMARPFAAAG
jgi:predicted ATP-grasp superfamily ATP-dependent carboligase